MKYIEYMKAKTDDSLLSNLTSGRTATQNYMIARQKTQEEAQAILQEIRANLSKIIEQSIEDAMKNLKSTEISITVKS